MCVFVPNARKVDGFGLEPGRKRILEPDLAGLTVGKCSACVLKFSWGKLAMCVSQ